ncbi:MAG: rhodanese-like domain-containing protein [Pseudomonadota bacterium]
MRLPHVDPADCLTDRPFLLDARKPEARAKSGRVIAGARPIDPLAFGHAEAAALLDEIGRERPITVFCVHGHEVSQFLCALLLVHKGRARYVRGGFEGLEAAPPPGLEIEEITP